MEEIFLTTKFNFCASHRYYNKKWSKEKNEKVFGKLTNFHGHNYVLEVTVTGEVDKETGMIINIDKLKKIVNRVIDKFDHKNLNKDLPYFKKIQPSTENISRILFKLIEENLPSRLNLYKIRLYESDDFWVDCYEQNIEISKSFKFFASHKLSSKNYSRQKNLKVFGRCSNPSGHGHEYKIILTCKGNINEETGFVVDRKKLEKSIKNLEEKLNYKDLNRINFFKKYLPTGENIIIYLKEKIPEDLKKKINKITLYETPKNIFEMEVYDEEEKN